MSEALAVEAKAEVQSHRKATECLNRKDRRAAEKKLVQRLRALGLSEGQVNSLLKQDAKAGREAPLVHGAMSNAPEEHTPAESPRLEQAQPPRSEPQPAKVSLLHRIVSHVKQRFSLWRDQRGVAFATRNDATGQNHIEVRSKAFPALLRLEYNALEGMYPQTALVRDAIEQLEAAALYEGVEHRTWVRTGSVGDELYLDLGAGRGTIRITPEGWTLVEECPVRFRRPSSQRPLPMPVRGGNISELRSFVNVGSDEHFRLLVGVVASWLRAEGPDFMLAIVGPHGSAKSSMTRLLLELIDPSVAEARTMSSKEEDLVIAAQNALVLGFDNLSGLSDAMSDNLCRLSTGATLTRRKLYHDMDETIIPAQAAVIVNGISFMVDRPDALSRAIVLDLPEIRGGRRTEADFWCDFRAAHPRILGALLDGVSGALRIIRDGGINTNSFDLPRMADAALFGAAAYKALGWGDDFLRLLRENQDDAVEVVLEHDPVSKAVAELLRRRGAWEGTSTDLHSVLSGAVSADERRSREWPAGGQQLSHRLDRLSQALERAGMRIERFRTTDARRQRMVRISYTEAARRPAAPEQTTPLRETRSVHERRPVPHPVLTLTVNPAPENKATGVRKLLGLFQRSA